MTLAISTISSARLHPALLSILVAVSLCDGQTVVIGGLVKRRTVIGESKVPILGDIPIIGRLFRSEKKSQEKVNLLVVLTPYVIRDRSDLRRILQRKMRERQALLRYFAKDGRPALALMTDLDFVYKSGLLSRIDRVGAAVEAQVALKRAATRHGASARELGPLVVATPPGGRQEARGGEKK